MDTRKERLVLNQNLAAVRIEPNGSGDGPAGVATVIPVGEIIEVDGDAPLMGRLRPVEWKGSLYCVFPEDLRELTPLPGFRDDNPGIVKIHGDQH